jgi:hypothetical protein
MTNIASWNFIPCSTQTEVAHPIEGLSPLFPENRKCKARSSSGPETQDCDWPFCGCDPHADKVIEAIQESGFAIRKIDAAAPSPEESAVIVHNGILREAVKKAIALFDSDPQLELREFKARAILQAALVSAEAPSPLAEYRSARRTLAEKAQDIEGFDPCAPVSA